MGPWMCTLVLYKLNLPIQGPHQIFDWGATPRTYQTFDTPLLEKM
jgi:hypothetical protein